MTPQEATQKDIKHLVQTITDQPNDWRAYVDLVNLLMMTENFVEAEELGLKSLGLFEQVPAALPHIYYALGNVYYSAGKYDLASDYFNKIEDLDLLHDAIMMQAQAWYAQNEFQKALVFALTGVEQDPKDIEAQILLGNIWLAIQNSWEASRAFDAALAIDSENFDANFARGLIATATGDRNNEWLLKAKQIDVQKYANQAQRLDEITQLLAGSQVDE